MSKYKEGDFWKMFVDLRLTLIINLIWDAVWSFPVKYAWNYTITYLFGFPEITWLHAFCLYFVISSMWRIVPVANGTLSRK